MVVFIAESVGPVVR